MTRILMTRRWPAGAEERLRGLGDVHVHPSDSQLSPGALAEALREFDIVCPTVSDRFGRAASEGGGLKTKLLASFGVGVDHISPPWDGSGRW